MPRSIPDGIPLAGRLAELEQITGRLTGAPSPAFVLAGAPGVGKTRLAAEVGRVASGLGFAVAEVVASRAAASIPFGPFAPLLPDEGPASDLLGLLRRAGEAILTHAASDGRLLLVVDDAHLLDDGSAALVHQLVTGGVCAVVATVRTHEPAPDLVTALWKDRLAERFELDPLGEDEVAEVVGAFLGGHVAGASVRRLWELSQGNPLYLRELLIGGIDSGALAQSGGIWSLHLQLGAPPRLVELVAARLEGIDEGTLAAIHLVAAGEPLPLALLEQLASPDAIEDAERRGFVHVQPDGRRAVVRLVHPLYGETLRQMLPAYRLRRISGELARALVATGARRRDDLLRLARWQLDGGVAESDPALLGRAARRAIEMFDLDLAAQLAERALESGGDLEAGIVLAETRFQTGRPAEAETVLAALVGLCTNDLERARVASARAYNLHVLVGDTDAAAAVIDEALQTISEPAARLRLQGRLATNRLMDGRPEEALAAARPLLESADDADVGRGAYAGSIALALLGRGDEAVATAHLGLEAHRRTGGIGQLPVVQLIGSIIGRLVTGQLAEAETEAADGYEACLAAGDREGQATFSLLRGCVLVERGHVGPACTSFLEGAAINRELQDVSALRWCLGGLALAAGMAGRLAQAREAADELDGLRGGGTGLFELDLVERGRAWAQVAAGETSRALATLDAAAARAATSHQWVAEARLRHDVARIGDPALAASRLDELSTILRGRFAGALAQHATALQLGSGADVEAAGAMFEAFGACLLAAEADLAAARLHREAGLEARAAALARRADALLALCGEARTPGLQIREAAARLTRREREIAGLAAAGVTSPEIATRLVLSVRTVENHLQNVFTKLAIGSRSELSSALATRDADAN